MLAIWDWTGVDYWNAAAYLGRVNLVSLLPGFFLASAYFYALYRASKQLFKRPSVLTNSALMESLLVWVILISFMGYLWFVITFPAENGDTIKATYQIQVFVVLPLVAANLLERISGRWPAAFGAAMFVLGLVALHNLPAMMTRYIYF